MTRTAAESSTRTASERQTIDIHVSDATGQKSRYLPAAPVDCTVGELVNQVVRQMSLDAAASDRPIAYQARLEREGRHLHAAERVADALQAGDRISLQPSINAA